MEISLSQAREAASAGDVPVGAAVLAPDGRLLAACQNRVERDSDPTAHAEILALRQAGKTLATARLGGCLLISTLEPCPMCVGAIILARIAGVVFGAADGRAGAVASALDKEDFPNAAFWHMGGIRADACVQLLQEFFAKRRLETECSKQRYFFAAPL